MFIFLFLFIFNFADSVDRIWLIRHCDKPSRGDCCNPVGYERSILWSNYFNSHLSLSPSPSILEGMEGPSKLEGEGLFIVTAGYDDKRLCIPKETGYESRCQHSQRMYITASSLARNLAVDLSIKIPLDYYYCIGEYRSMIKMVYERKEKDVIIVWEHNEIVEIIRYLGISIDDWKHKYEDNYAQVFMYDNVNIKLYIDSLDNTTVGYNYPNIDQYFTDKKIVTRKVGINKYVFSIVMFIMIGLIGFLICIGYLGIIYYNKYKNMNNIRYKYVKITSEPAGSTGANEVSFAGKKGYGSNCGKGEIIV